MTDLDEYLTQWESEFKINQYAQPDSPSPQPPPTQFPSPKFSAMENQNGASPLDDLLSQGRSRV